MTPAERTATTSATRLMLALSAERDVAEIKTALAALTTAVRRVVREREQREASHA